MKPSGVPTWLRWIPAVTYAGLIFVASSMPKPPLYIPVPYIDKPIHFFEYAILCLLICWPLSTDSLTKRAVLFSIIAASLYGASDEIHQYFVPGRTAEISDWVSDTVGASVAGFIWYKRNLYPPQAD